MKKVLVFIFATMLIMPICAQMKKLTVLNVDTQGLNFTPEQMGNLLRIEAEKLGVFQVTDRYDVDYLIKKNGLKIENCYGKLCLVEIGKEIKTDKILTGTVEKYGETIIISLRLIDMETEQIEKTQVREFLNLPTEMQNMVRLTLNEMVGKEIDKNMLDKLTKVSEYASTINNPNQQKVNNSGPRMGYTFFTGEAAKVLRADKLDGGFDVYPALFIFGYQFEIQYLNEGNFQALFEIIPSIAGLDQSLFIPSVTFMNGLRNNLHGWEIAFGPLINFGKVANGYFDANNKWTIPTDGIIPDGFAKAKRMDSRGDSRISSSFVIGIGKTFKSGRLSIPVNAYIMPDKTGMRFGISLGYNVKKNK